MYSCGGQVVEAPGAGAATHVDRQAFVRELVDHRQALSWPVGAGIDNEVVCPHLVGRAGWQWWGPASVPWTNYRHAANIVTRRRCHHRARRVPLLNRRKRFSKTSAAHLGGA